jgi:hypothetical protein
MKPSASISFQLLVTSSLSGPYILLSTVSSNTVTVGLCSSFKGRQEFDTRPKQQAKLQVYIKINMVFRYDTGSKCS